MCAANGWRAGASPGDRTATESEAVVDEAASPQRGAGRFEWVVAAARRLLQQKISPRCTMSKISRIVVQAYTYKIPTSSVDLGLLAWG